MSEAAAQRRPWTRRGFIAAGLATLVGPACRGGSDAASDGGDIRTPSPGRAATTATTATTTSVASADTPAEQGLEANPFTLGVASGDPTPDAVVIWTRLAPNPEALDAGFGDSSSADFTVAWDVATDEQFADLVASGVVTAAAVYGHSARVDVGGLRAGRRYRYRFRIGPWTSAIGHTRTAPDSTSTDERLVVAVASCQHYEMGFYAAHRHLAAEQVDLVVFLGDFIYEAAAVPGGVRAHPDFEAADLDTYRHRYAWYRRDEDLQAAQAAAPWLVVWDDHEVQNNYAGDRAAGADPSNEFASRRAAAYQAWWENQPVRLPPPGAPDFRVSREIRWGALASFVMLDGRSARSPQVCGGSVGVACADLEDPTRTMLGEAQESWVAETFSRSAGDGITWTILGNQTALTDLTVPFGTARITLFDQWDGYPAARRRLLQTSASAGVANLVALTGDLHCSIAADLVEDGVVYGSEILASSISSMFAPGGGALFELGLSLLDQVKAIDTARRGYVRAEFDAQRATFTFRHLDDPLDPVSAIATTSSWQLIAGRPGLQAG